MNYALHSDSDYLRGLLQIKSVHYENEWIGVRAYMKNERNGSSNKMTNITQ
jgi:hypothetical protein